MKHRTIRIIPAIFLIFALLFIVTPVQAENLPPVAVEDYYSLSPDFTLQTNLSLTFWPLANDYDPEGDRLIWIRILCSSPCWYKDNLDGSVTFTPDPSLLDDYYSSVYYLMGDGTNIVMGTVFIRVTPVGSGDHPPVANNPGFTIAHDTPLTISKEQLGYDPDGEDWILTLDIPAVGLMLNLGDHLSEITVQPWPGWIGTTQFRYIMSSNYSDGRTDGYVTITVTGPVTATFPVMSGRDDVNQDGLNAFAARNNGVWIGRGDTLDSYTGLRFVSTAMPPPGVIITDAYLEVYSPTAQWIRVNVTIAGEKTVDSVPFTYATRPSTRTLTTALVTNRSDVPWGDGSWNQYRGLAPVIQEIVDQPDWHYSYQYLSSSLTLIMHGMNGRWARKFAASYETGALYAPRLVITYTLP